MAQKAVVDAVSARLAAQWSACPVYGSNVQGEVPLDGSPFLLTQYPVANVQRTTHSRTYREEGAIRLVISVERGSGIAQALAWGDQLATLFRGQTFGGVECKAPTSPLVHDDNDDGLYFRTSVVVPYWFSFRDD